MLWWRCFKKEEIVRKTEKRKEENEKCWKCGNPTKCLFGSVEGGGLGGSVEELKMENSKGN